ncbi:TlpA disulfide reductase family protein [Filimonas effusa]|uniref:TlpA family protein disulfide reductase n=1 Tax=Filimonas effusa TaxID=2508721 RepID=A0A4Q1DC33_9BACT|nr:TlpA disulfide reductase family protein [Filimonas effusa]RXK86900.1 TlpA family protein disulfide reductase [Filimonas effusa]
MIRIVNRISKIAYLAIVALLVSKTAQAQFASAEDKALKETVGKLAGEGKKTEALAAMYKISNVNTRNSAMSDYISGLFSAGDEKAAMAFAAKQLDSLKALRLQPDMKYAYSNLALPYATTLVRYKRYEEAYAILNPLLAANETVHYTVHETYVKALMGLGRYHDALNKVKELIMDGKASPFVSDTAFEQAYTHWKGNAHGFSMLKDSVNKAWKSDIWTKVSAEAMQTPAPGFELKDADGKLVSLASLKGKTVVLDFWANWCQPCKASFPVMKMAQERYRKDPGVVFLFIHCFEREADPLPEAVTYMKGHNFDFRVLFDLRDTATKESPVAKSFNVRGIPTKCIIDPQGNLRFTSVGGTKYTETDVQAVEHIATMIEFARKNS